MKLNKIVMGVSAVLMAGATSAWAATATVAMSGSVPEVTTVVPGAIAPLGIDLNSGLALFDVVTLTETCNKKNGYSLGITSENADSSTKDFSLKGTATSDLIPYTLKHGADGTLFTKNTDAAHTYTKTPKTGTAVHLYLTIAAGDYSADSYSDTITITITGI